MQDIDRLVRGRWNVLADDGVSFVGPAGFIVAQDTLEGASGKLLETADRPVSFALDESPIADRHAGRRARERQ